MRRWHETVWARIGLRLAGLLMLGSAWAIARAIYGQVHAGPSAAASLGELAECAVLVIMLIVGNALLMMGAGLWKQVEIPSRWSAAQSEARQFEMLLARTEP